MKMIKTKRNQKFLQSRSFIQSIGFDLYSIVTGPSTLVVAGAVSFQDTKRQERYSIGVALQAHLNNPDLYTSPELGPEKT